MGTPKGMTPFLPLPKVKDSFEETAFYSWLDSGTCSKAIKALEKKGVVNPRTGKPYTYMAVYFAAYRYLAKNHAELKPVLFDLWGMREGMEMSDAEWEAYIVHKAVFALGNNSKGAFMRWLEENPWAEKYDYLYAKRFGLTQKSSPNI
jgi:hypothetical protein